MRKDDVGFEVANFVCKPIHHGPIDFERIVAKIKGYKTRAQDGGGSLCFSPANGFHVLFGLAGLLP